MFIINKVLLRLRINPNYCLKENISVFVKCFKLKDKHDFMLPGDAHKLSCKRKYLSAITCMAVDI